MSDRFQNTLQLAISILIGLFPVLSIAVQGGGSMVLILLFLLSLVFAWPAWRELHPDEKKWMWSLLAFGVIFCLLYVTTANWKTGYVSIEHFARLVAIVPIYMMVRRFKPSLLKPLLIGSALAILILFYQSIVLYQVDDIGVKGVYYRIFFGDSVVLFTLWIGLAVIHFYNDRRALVAASVLIFLGLYATVVSFCRNAWLLIPFLVPVMLFLYKSELNRRHVAWVAGLVVVVSVALTLWTPSSLERGLQKGVNSIESFMNSSDTDSSSAIRIKLWHDSLLMAKKHPLVGVGIGNFGPVRDEMIRRGETYHSKSLGHAHSIFMHSLATTGLIGLLSMLIALFIMPWRLLYKQWVNAPQDPWLRFSILGGLLSLFAFAHFGLTEAWLNRNPFVNLYVLSIVTFIASVQNLQTKGKYVLAGHDSRNEESDQNIVRQVSHQI